jgi:hypothetical protein
MRKHLFAIAGIAALLAAGSASPIAANNAAVDRAMLTMKEVPASFGKATSRDFDAKIIGKTIGICDNAAGRTLVSVPAPPTQYLVDIETKNKKTYTEIFERVYQFGTEAKAQAAFTELSSKLTECNGTTSLTNQQPSLKQTVTTGTYPGGEFQDFWVNVSGTWSGGELKKPSRTVVNAVYTQAGNAIIETVAYINGRGKLTAKQRTDLADLAENLSNRFRNYSIGNLAQ